MATLPAIARRLRLTVAVIGAAAVLLAWPASYLVEFDGHLALGRQFDLDTGPGWFAVTVRRTVLTERHLRGSVSALTAERRHGLAYPRVYSAPNDYYFLAPFWVAELAAGLTVGAVVATRRMAYRPPGVCRACGYDLRATPDRCPECGTAVTAEPRYVVGGR